MFRQNSELLSERLEWSNAVAALRAHQADVVGGEQ